VAQNAVKLRVENESFVFYYMVFFPFSAVRRFLMFSFVDAFRNSDTAKKITRLIWKLAGDSRRYRIVHVCSTNKYVITKHGVRSMLPGNV
jgi:hypothetical protein